MRMTALTVNENDILTKKLVFLDFSLTWVKIIECSLTIPAFPEYSYNGLFFRFSRFSMNPV